MPIDLALADPAATFRPGDAVPLKVAWTADRAPDRVEVRLIYRTAGKGTSDVVAVASDSRAFPGANEQWTLTLIVPPDAPPAYDGRLLSVSWLAQADAIGQKRSDRESAELPLLVSPVGRPITPQRLTK